MSTGKQRLSPSRTDWSIEISCKQLILNDRLRIDVTRWFSGDDHKRYESWLLETPVDDQVLSEIETYAFSHLESYIAHRWGMQKLLPLEEHNR